MLNKIQITFQRMVQFDGLNLKCFGATKVFEILMKAMVFLFGNYTKFYLQIWRFQGPSKPIYGPHKEAFSNLKVFLKHFRVLVKLQNHMSYNMKSEFTGSIRNLNPNISEIIYNYDATEPCSTL